MQPCSARGSSHPARGLVWLQATPHGAPYLLPPCLVPQLGAPKAITGVHACTEAPSVVLVRASGWGALCVCMYGERAHVCGVKVAAHCAPPRAKLGGLPQSQSHPHCCADYQMAPCIVALAALCILPNCLGIGLPLLHASQCHRLGITPSHN